MRMRHVFGLALCVMLLLGARIRAGTRSAAPVGVRGGRRRVMPNLGQRQRRRHLQLKREQSGQSEAPGGRLTNGALKYIHRDALHVPWPAYTIDRGILPVSITGLFTAIGFDSVGTPSMAYHFDNATNVDALMVAYQRFQVFLPLVMRNE